MTKKSLSDNSKIEWTIIARSLSQIKVKVRPRTGHEGPDGEERYNPTLSLTSLLNRSGWLKPRPNRFTSGKDPVLYQLYRRLGGPQSRSGLVRKNSPPPGFYPRTVQPIVSRYIDYAIPAHLCLRYKLNISKIQFNYFSLFHPVFPKPQNFCMKWILSAEGRSCTYQSTCWLVKFLVSLLQQFNIYVPCKVLRNSKCLLLQVTRGTGSVISPLCSLLQYIYLRGRYQNALGQVFVTVAMV